jgi:hypothetical protein
MTPSRTPSQNPPRPHAPAGTGSPPQGPQSPQEPNPDQTPSRTPRSAEGRSQSSSAASSAARSFISDPGPAFDPKAAPAAPEVEEPELELEEWDEQRVRELLTLQGEITHAVLKVGDRDEETWKHTKRDLDTIAPPLTRIMNRYDVTRAAAAAGDEILLVTAVGRYGFTNYTKRRRLIRDQAPAGPQPVWGAGAPEETGPEHDEEYSRVHAVHFEAPMTEPPPAITPGRKR